MKHNVINQFLKDVVWGDLDYLIIDFPPGTGDEALSISQMLDDITGSIIVSTPQEVSLLDVRKSIDFSKKVNVPVIGLIENMAGDIFGRGSVESMARSMNIPFLGSLEMDKDIALSGDTGIPFSKDPQIPSARAFRDITEKIISTCKKI